MGAGNTVTNVHLEKYSHCFSVINDEICCTVILTYLLLTASSRAENIMNIYHGLLTPQLTLVCSQLKCSVMFFVIHLRITDWVVRRPNISISFEAVIRCLIHSYFI